MEFWLLKQKNVMMVMKKARMDVILHARRKPVGLVKQLIFKMMANNSNNPNAKQFVVMESELRVKNVMMEQIILDSLKVAMVAPMSARLSLATSVMVILVNCQYVA